MAYWHVLVKIHQLIDTPISSLPLEISELENLEYVKMEGSLMKKTPVELKDVQIHLTNN